VRLSDEKSISNERWSKNTCAKDRVTTSDWKPIESELYAAMALEQSPDSLLVLNGFKDEEFIELAYTSAKSGKRVVIVIEKLSELDHILRIAENHEGNMPMIGMRVKLYSKGSGRWEKSGGEAAKFGLTTTELLEVINRLKEAGRTTCCGCFIFTSARN